MSTNQAPLLSQGYGALHQVDSQANNLTQQTPKPKEQEVRLAVKSIYLPAEYPLEQYRWVSLFFYMLCALTNSIPVHTFSSINTTVEREFQISKFLVTINALLFPIIHPIVAVPSSWVLEKYGVRAGCILGSLILTGGVWLRTKLAVGQATLCLVGTVLAGIGNVFVMNSTSKLAVNWFPSTQVPNIISMTVLANLMSLTLGASLPGLFIPKNSTAQDISTLLLIEAIVVTVPTVLIIFFLRQKPATPPSKAAAALLTASAKQKMPYTTVLKKLLTRKEYLLIMLAMSLCYGSQTALIANLDQILKTLGCNNTNQMTGIIILACMAAGILGTPFFAGAIKRTNQYRMIGMLCALGCFFAVTGLQAVFYLGPNETVFLSIMSILAGFFLLPSTSIFLSYSSQVAYPLGEATSTGLMFAASQTMGFLLGFGVVKILEGFEGNKNAILGVFGLFSFLFLAAVGATMATKEDLRRNKAEKQPLVV